MATRPTFVRGGEFLCNQDLDFSAMPGGRVFRVGETLPWRTLGLHDRKIGELWIANMIDSAPTAAPAARPTQQPLKQQRR